MTDYRGAEYPLARPLTEVYQHYAVRMAKFGARKKKLVLAKY